MAVRTWVCVECELQVSILLYLKLEFFISTCPSCLHQDRVQNIR